jgi:hypothetical protein
MVVSREVTRGATVPEAAKNDAEFAERSSRIRKGGEVVHHQGAAGRFSLQKLLVCQPIDAQPQFFQSLRCRQHVGFVEPEYEERKERQDHGEAHTDLDRPSQHQKAKRQEHGRRDCEKLNEHGVSLQHLRAQRNVSSHVDRDFIFSVDRRHAGAPALLGDWPSDLFKFDADFQGGTYETGDNSESALDWVNVAQRA